MSVSLTIITNKDYPLISDMAYRIWHHHYVSIIGAEQVAYMLREMYTPAAIQKQVSEDQTFYLIMHHQLPVGYMSISQKEPQVYMLHKFYIEIDQQGKNLGKQAFETLLQILSNAQKITLTVNRQNYKSINFYFKLGFHIESVADFDIGNGYYMNDFVMSKNI